MYNDDLSGEWRISEKGYEVIEWVAKAFAEGKNIEEIADELDVPPEAVQLMMYIDSQGGSVIL